MALTESEELELLELEEEEALSKRKSESTIKSEPAKEKRTNPIQDVLFTKQSVDMPENNAFDTFVKKPVSNILGLASLPARAVGAMAGQGDITDSKTNAFRGAMDTNNEVINKIPNTGIKVAGADVTEYARTPLKFLNDIGGSVAGDPLAWGPGAIKTTLKGIAKGAGAYDALTGKVASATTGVSEEALRTATTKEGRAALQDAAGKEHEIGQQLVSKLDDAYRVIREAPKASAALQKVPNVNVVPMITRLEKLAGTPKTKELQAAADQILGKAEELRNLAAEAGNGGFVPAADLYDFRQEIDQVIGDEFGKSSGKYISALKKVRHDIKQSLLDVAKGTEYEEGMKDLATKLDAIDKLKGMLGKSTTTQEGRAESFIRNINNMGKEQQRQWLDQFQQVFGGDFISEAKTANLAKQLGDNGTAAWMPQHFTGKSLLGIGASSALHSPVVGVAMSSPKIVTRAVLPVTQGISSAASKLAEVSKKLPTGLYGAGGISQFLQTIMNGKK